MRIKGFLGKEFKGPGTSPHPWGRSRRFIPTPHRGSVAPEWPAFLTSTCVMLLSSLMSPGRTGQDRTEADSLLPAAAPPPSLQGCSTGRGCTSSVWAPLPLPSSSGISRCAGDWPCLPHITMINSQLYYGIRERSHPQAPPPFFKLILLRYTLDEKSSLITSVVG